MKKASSNTTPTLLPRDQDGGETGGADGFPVVGLGASAGGLEAVTQLLGGLPADPGMAFVLIQHLDPDHKSMLPELLSRATKLPVQEAQEGMRVESNHVYVIPRNASMVISAGLLKLTPRQKEVRKYLPVDHFLYSLAEDQKSKAIGVILSGTASDGALGVRAVKAEGGITFAQDESSAKFPGMPQSAIATGCVDFVLPPQNIAQELAALSRHPYVRLREPSSTTEAAPEETDSLNSIFRLLRSATGVDFAHYKPATIKRRVSRRMAVHQMEHIGEYARFLSDHPEETARLHEDLLISVTEFFRDAPAFLMLQTRVFPRLVKHRPANSPVRIWAPGCSSGEEVYSIAICLLEAVAEAGGEFDIQIFGSDISDLAIERARAGLYPFNIRQHVSPERLERFFVKREAGYQISKRIRELCVFAKHNLTKDPPYSRLDLISCQNVLIYLGVPLQREVVAVLHYALKPGGFLLLGDSESLGTLETFFEPQDKKVKLYAKKLTGPVARPEPATEGLRDTGPSLPDLVRRRVAGDPLVLQRYGPPSVVINENMEIVSFRGDTSPYLLAAPGAPPRQLLKMAHGTLAAILRSTIGEAKKLDKAVQRKDLRVESEGWSKNFNLDVMPITSSHGTERLWKVLFHESGASRAGGRQTASTNAKAAGQGQSRAQMAADLVATKDGMQSLLEEYEATTEELQSANEEIQSSNEELQSTNEELQSSKEELQASNEELLTVNEEMQNRNIELTQAHDDLLNLFSNVNTPIVMVTNDLRIRRFTPAAEKLMNLIPADVGRPISNINLGLVGENLEQEVRNVVETLAPTERVVQDRVGCWYLMRIRPYRTSDNRIEGAVVVLVEIDELKRSRDLVQTVLDTMRECLVVLDDKNRVKTANLYFYHTFNVRTSQTEGRVIYDVAEGMLNVPKLHDLVDGARLHDTRLQNVKIDFERLGERKRTMYLNAQRLPDTEMVLLIAREPTDLL
ncbi:MAG TPA: chemotaxis protein CheB [Gemmatimonadales bacterium]|nr:chemotaxis protein CheB [Gemmatimonadales bacterium]